MMSSSGSTPFRTPKYALWVADRDEKGVPVDPRFVQAAYALEPTLFSYRRRELGCESITATLVQASVNAASRAAHSQPVSNPVGYLLTTFTRKVDKQLANADREVPVEDDFIEDINSREESKNYVVRILENRILLQQVKDQMHEWTRQVLNMRIAGYSIEEIARDLGEPANRVSVRYLRGVAKAVERLSNPVANKRQSRADAK
jgi:DNA-directed RNA polymerase specialized sigma24 family protein